MKALIASIATLLWVLPVFGAGDDTILEFTEKPRASVARQESLELPGLTACHQCEWRPKPHTKAAAEQCGLTPDGAPRMAVFECGFSPECDRVCNFLQCTE
jgi:hypothetical protein